VSSVSIVEGCISSSSHVETTHFVFKRMVDTGNLITTLMLVFCFRWLGVVLVPGLDQQFK